MVDISKLAGSKRSWVGDQQAYDYDDSEYDDFKTDGTLTGSNTVSNVLWKHAKLHESGGQAEWIGSSQPGNIALDVYNDAISFPNNFDFANNSDNVKLSQLAYKTALIHADFKANDYDTLEATVETNTSNITSLEDDFKEMDVRNITTHRIELDSNNSYTLPNLFKITYSADSWAFTAKTFDDVSRTFPGTQGKIKIEVLNWTNFYKWCTLVDHIGLLIETDLTTGAAGIGVSDIYETDGVTKDTDEWEYFSMTKAGTIKRSYLIHFQVPNSTQINVFFYLPREKINDYNITWDKSDDYDAFYSSDLNQSVQFTNGTYANTKFTLIAYNDTIENFDVIYQPTKTISKHPLNSNADTIALATKINEIWTPDKVILESPNDFTHHWNNTFQDVDIRKVITWTPNNQYVSNYKLELKNTNSINPTFKITTGNILGTGHKLLCDAEVDILSISIIPSSVIKSNTNTNIPRTAILSDNQTLNCFFGLFARLETTSIEWGSIQGYKYGAQTRINLKIRSCYHRMSTTGSIDGDSITYFSTNVTICSDWFYKGTSPYTTRVINKVYAEPGLFNKDNEKYVLAPIITNLT